MSSVTLSVVWNFFKKVDRQNVSCNLCGKTYKSSGNTTNLSTHLKNKHHHAFLQLKNKNVRSSEVNITPRTSSPVSFTNSTSTITSIPAEINNNLMELSESAIYDDTGTESSKNSQSKDLLKQTTLINMFERSSSYEEGGHKTSEINQALVYMICKDNMPLSCVEKSGLKRLMSVICPRYKIPSRTTITGLMEQRYATTKAIVKRTLSEINNIAVKSDILTLMNSTRSFIVVTAHIFNTANNCTPEPEHEMVTLTARRMYQAHTADYIKECFENITNEFSIERDCIVSITTDGGANMVAAVKKFLEDGKKIPCMAHLLNLIVDGATRDNAPVLQIANRVKAIVTYFKQSVNAMDDLRAEQEGQKKEGEVLTLIQSISTRWNSCLDMLERFNTLSAIVAKILATRWNAPDMITSSELDVIRDLIILLTPFKQATEEITGDQYVTSSLVIPITNLLQKGLEQIKPFTEFGIAVQKSLLNLVIAKLEPLERHLHLAKATILDPRFKRFHFSSALAVSTVINALSKEIRLEHRGRGQLSPEPRPTPTTIIPNSENSSPSLWSGHEKIMIDIAAASANSLLSTSTSDGMSSELKQYLDQPIMPRKENRTKFWFDCRNFTPVLSDIALQYLTSPASSVSSERVASAVNLAVPNNRSRARKSKSFSYVCIR